MKCFIPAGCHRRADLSNFPMGSKPTGRYDCYGASRTTRLKWGQAAIGAKVIAWERSSTSSWRLASIAWRLIAYSIFTGA
jgi:hypothetical protein